jgi:hypothetical protein
MRKVQARRETEERELAQSADQQEETAQHKRRAEKARYLREKLEDRGKSERETDSDAEQ